MAKRILLLGTTGVDKKAACNNLRLYRQSYTNVDDLRTVDFVEEFIKPRIDLPDFLDSREDRQRTHWLEAWKDFERSLAGMQGDVILSLHGVLVRPLYGVRTAVDFDAIKSFKPDKLVTLIDDVYAMWARTEERAGGEDWRGRPSLEQLLAGRRAEIFLGDILKNHLGLGRQINTVIAVRHPARILDRLIYGPGNLTRVYLSFPISGPRKRLSDRNDASGILEINNFLRSAADIERQDGSVVFFCPLTIDELPLIKTLEGAGTDEVEFRMENRWNVADFWDNDRLLLMDTEPPDVINLRRDHIDRAEGIIRADVPTRDYRLVMQSDYLAVFNPWYDGEQTGGVGNEIECALFHSKPVHIYQDTQHDPNGEARRTLKPAAGSLGQRPGTEYITFYDSPGELLASCSRR